MQAMTRTPGRTTTRPPADDDPARLPGSAEAGPLRRLWRGRADDPAWARPALIMLLLGTGVLYLWDLGASGWANSFYSAAAQAGSESWQAFLFGSSDAANSITVDKTPLALWPMALSVRLFGLSGWSILVPQALMGVATVGLVYHLARRAAGSPVAGLLAGSVLALTPVAVLMFRFNNPDALLVLLLTAAAAVTLRAVDDTRVRGGHPVRWLALAGALVGLGFLAKMLQAFLVLPALVLAYLLFARTSLGRRLGHLLVAFGAMLLTGGWWVALAELWPASSRPYIGGSQHNSIVELILGYNGLGRLSGNETGSVGGGPGGGWGETGPFRLFTSEVGGQVAWLLPAACLLGVAALWFGRRDQRLRAALTLCLAWLMVTAATFSFMAGIFHAYYTVALSAPIAALVGIGGWTLWRHRQAPAAAAVLAASTALTAVLAWLLLDRAAGFVPWLKWLIVVVGLVAAMLLVGARLLTRRVTLVAAIGALIALLAGPSAYAVATAAQPHSGAIPSAGPATGGLGGRPPVGFPVGPNGGPGAGTAGGRQGGPNGAPSGVPGGAPQGAFGGQPGPGAGTFGGPGGTQPGGGTPQPGTGRPAPTAAGGLGGLLDGSTPTAAVTALLSSDAETYTWVAATVGSNAAAGYQLATQRPVMAIGGFNGSDPSPTLAEFQRYVADGEIHFFIASGGMGAMGGSAGATGTGTEIEQWVEANFTAATVGGVTVYDLWGGVR